MSSAHSPDLVCSMAAPTIETGKYLENYNLSLGRGQAGTGIRSMTHRQFIAGGLS